MIYKSIPKIVCILFFVNLSYTSTIFAQQTCRTVFLPATTPTEQFINNNDGTVTDTKTNLMWKRCAEGRTNDNCSVGSNVTVTWEGALQRVLEVNRSGGFAGQTDWRIPNIKELMSLVEFQCYEPAINLTVFPYTIDTLNQLSQYWSSTPCISVGSYYSLEFFYGNIVGYSGDGPFFHRVRLVRDATN